IEIPDRKALAMDSHFEAAKGAYMIRSYQKGMPRMGTVVVQGTSTTNNLVKILPALDQEGINVKIVAAISPQLFALQDESYRNRIYSAADRMDAMAVTNRARRLLSDWIDPGISDEYTLSSDWDNRWRTGGSLDEVIEEAHLSAEWMLAGIRKFARDRAKRLKRLADQLDMLTAEDD
ncbi:MAG: transketolase, partial [Candidatus Latescibacterota bacterium]